MKLLPISDLLVQKPRPQGTLSLIDVFWKNPREMVETYIVTDTLRHHLSAILEMVATGRGQGFWVQAEYGAGKTHFLAVLAALLANHQDGLWDLVKDAEINRYQTRLQDVRLFPVVVSLRGQTQGDRIQKRSLLDVILEGVEAALQKAELTGRVRVTAEEDYLDWLERRGSSTIRQDIETLARKQLGRTVDELRRDGDVEELARLIAAYCQTNEIDLRVAASVKERLAHVYRQITGMKGQRYTGLLVVIDEYEGWEKSRSDTERVQDEDTLETLGYLLPRDLGQNVYTVVGSQSAVPAKLMGAEAGSRFIPVPLLSTQNERDYDIIVSRRVRALREDRTPEIHEYYRYCQEQFDFARSLSEEEFADTFPFQPRCFEVVRHFTAEGLPTARAGISIFWEAVNHPELLKRETLIRVADLLVSQDLQDCLATPMYKDAYNAYRAACETLPTLDLDETDRPLAQAVLNTLFMWHLAYAKNPRPMSTKDLAQATLATSDWAKAEDAVLYVLGQLQMLPQIKVENQEARFDAQTVFDVWKLFEQYRQKAEKDAYSLSAQWTESLFFTTKEHGANGVFATFSRDQEFPFRLEHRNLEYAGNVIIASRWREEWGYGLPKTDTHFRIVILTSEAAQSVRAQDLHDPRVAVVYPGALTDAARQAAARYSAWRKLGEDFAEGKRIGKEAEAVRQWLLERKGGFLKDLIDTQRTVYMAGQIVTRDELGLSAREAFGQTSNDRSFSVIAEALLSSAYAQIPIEWGKLRGTLRAQETGRVFNGYFDKTPGSSERAATQNFGVALGLSHPEKPGAFAPQQAKALELIGAMLSEGEGQTQVWKVYEKLAAPPYGLPYPVIQLYLLAFVRARGKVELTLRPDHKLKTRTGQAWQRDRLTNITVVDLEYKAGLEKAFHELVEGVGPIWNDAEIYAREVADVHQATDPGETEHQAKTLDHALTELAVAIGNTRRQLEVLERNFGAKLPQATTQALDRLSDIAGAAGAGYATFHERATATYRTPDDLREDKRTLSRLSDLAARAVDINDVRDYLADVKLRPGDTQLDWNRRSILTRLTLDNLAAQPNQWDSLKDEFERFRKEYLYNYKAHHRDTNLEMQRLKDKLADAPRQLRALELLDGIRDVGAPMSQDIKARLDAAQAKLRICPVAMNDLTLEASPVCEQCKLPLTENAPTAEVEGISADLGRSLKEQQRWLASEAIRRILEKSKEPEIGKFLQVIQAANLASLVDVMNEDLATYIKVLLAEENTAVGEFSVQRLVHDYPALDEADVPKAVKHFEDMLRQAFAEARQANPGKKTVRLTLR